MKAKKKKQDSKDKFVTIIALTIILLSIVLMASSKTIASQEEKDKWSVHFIEDSYHIKKGSVPADSVSIDNAMINYDITLKEAGDKYESYVDVINDGTLRAQLNTVTTTPLTKEEEKYLNVELTYNYANKGQDYRDFGDGNIALEHPLILNPKMTARLNIKVEYKKNVNSDYLPEGDASVSLTTNLNFAQVD